MTRQPKTLAFWTSRLPHWEVEGGRYFVTIRLAGALPPAGRDRVRQLAQEFRRLDPRTDVEPWLRLKRQVFREMEDWLHRAEAVTYLRQPELAEMVVEAIEHRRQRGDWNMLEYVVLPNHIHLFFEITCGSLRGVLMDFKRWTGHLAAEMADLAGEPFWQRDWFDHWSRSDEEDERIIAYIRDNPVLAGLVRHFLQWPYGSWAAQDEADAKE